MNGQSEAGAPVLRLSHFCYRRRKTLAPQGPRKLPKLDVAGSTPVARSQCAVTGATLARTSACGGHDARGLTVEARLQPDKLRPPGCSWTVGHPGVSPVLAAPYHGCCDWTGRFGRLDTRPTFLPRGDLGDRAG